MKTCKKCGLIKDLSDFRIVGKYRRGTCKQCEAEETQLQSEKTKEYIKSKKKECSICGYNKSKSALDFHHVDSFDKEFNVSKYKRFRWTDEVKKKIDNEIEKCIVVCKNCHCEIHDGTIII